MKSRWSIAVIVEAIIWAAVIVAVSMSIGDLPQSRHLLTILGGGSAASIILLGGLGVIEKKTP